MKNIKLIVKTKSKTYPIYFGDNIINKTGEEMDAMIEQINVRPAYELPEKITKKWLSKGALFVTSGADISFMMQGSEATLKELGR